VLRLAAGENEGEIHCVSEGGAHLVWSDAAGWSVVVGLGDALLADVDGTLELNGVATTTEGAWLLVPQSGPVHYDAGIRLATLRTEGLPESATALSIERKPSSPFPHVVVDHRGRGVVYRWDESLSVSPDDICGPDWAGCLLRDLDSHDGTAVGKYLRSHLDVTTSQLSGSEDLDDDERETLRRQVATDLDQMVNHATLFEDGDFGVLDLSEEVCRLHEASLSEKQTRLSNRLLLEAALPESLAPSRSWSIVSDPSDDVLQLAFAGENAVFLMRDGTAKLAGTELFGPAPFSTFAAVEVTNDGQVFVSNASATDKIAAARYLPRVRGWRPLNSDSDVPIIQFAADPGRVHAVKSNGEAGFFPITGPDQAPEYTSVFGPRDLGTEPGRVVSAERFGKRFFFVRTRGDDSNGRVYVYDPVRRTITDAGLDRDFVRQRLRATSKWLFLAGNDDGRGVVLRRSDDAWDVLHEDPDDIVETVVSDTAAVCRDASGKLTVHIDDHRPHEILDGSAQRQWSRLAFDRFDRLWGADTEGGLAFYTPSKGSWTAVDSTSRCHDLLITELDKSTDLVFVGTDNGLTCWRASAGSFEKHSAYFRSRAGWSILTIGITNDELLWVAGVRRDSREIRACSKSDFLSHDVNAEESKSGTDTVWHLLFSSDAGSGPSREEWETAVWADFAEDELWLVASSGRLWRYDLDGHIRGWHAKRLSGDPVANLQMAEPGTLWWQNDKKNLFVLHRDGNDLAIEAFDGNREWRSLFTGWDRWSSSLGTIFWCIVGGLLTLRISGWLTGFQAVSQFPTARRIVYPLAVGLLLFLVAYGPWTREFLGNGCVSRLWFVGMLLFNLGAVCLAVRLMPGARILQHPAVQTCGNWELVAWLAGSGTVLVFVSRVDDVSAVLSAPAVQMVSFLAIVCLGSGLITIAIVVMKEVSHWEWIIWCYRWRSVFRGVLFGVLFSLVIPYFISRHVDYYLPFHSKRFQGETLDYAVTNRILTVRSHDRIWQFKYDRGSVTPYKHKSVQQSLAPHRVTYPTLSDSGNWRLTRSAESFGLSRRNSDGAFLPCHFDSAGLGEDEILSAVVTGRGLFTVTPVGLARYDRDIDGARFLHIDPMENAHGLVALHEDKVHYRARDGNTKVHTTNGWKAVESPWPYLHQKTIRWQGDPAGDTLLAEDFDEQTGRFRKDCCSGLLRGTDERIWLQTQVGWRLCDVADGDVDITRIESQAPRRASSVRELKTLATHWHCWRTAIDGGVDTVAFANLATRHQMRVNDPFENLGRWPDEYIRHAQYADDSLWLATYAGVRQLKQDGTEMIHLADYEVQRMWHGGGQLYCRTGHGDFVLQDGGWHQASQVPAQAFPKRRTLPIALGPGTEEYANEETRAGRPHTTFTGFQQPKMRFRHDDIAAIASESGGFWAISSKGLQWLETNSGYVARHRGFLTAEQLVALRRAKDDNYYVLNDRGIAWRHDSKGWSPAARDSSNPFESPVWRPISRIVHCKQTYQADGDRFSLHTRSGNRVAALPFRAGRIASDYVVDVVAVKSGCWQATPVGAVETSTGSNGLQASQVAVWPLSEADRSPRIAMDQGQMVARLNGNAYQWSPKTADWRISQTTAFAARHYQYDGLRWKMGSGPGPVDIVSFNPSGAPPTTNPALNRWGRFPFDTITTVSSCAGKLWLGDEVGLCQCVPIGNELMRMRYVLGSTVKSTGDWRVKLKDDREGNIWLESRDADDLPTGRWVLKEGEFVPPPNALQRHCPFELNSVSKPTGLNLAFSQSQLLEIGAPSSAVAHTQSHSFETGIVAATKIHNNVWILTKRGLFRIDQY